MKNRELLLSVDIKALTEKEIDLGKIIPLSKIDCKHISKIMYKSNKIWENLDNLVSFEDKTARYIKVTTTKDSKFNLFVGLGYYAEEAFEWTNAFNHKSGWSGGDGIFSFNLKNGNDSFDQRDAKTLFVFGDTLIGKSDSKTHKRLSPLLMPNNTLAYLNGNGSDNLDIDFRINTNDLDTIKAYFEPNNCSMYDGTLPTHLIKYDKSKSYTPYLSGYNPKSVELTFDLLSEYFVEYIDFYNYYLEDFQGFNLEKRGIKNFELSCINETGKVSELGSFILDIAENSISYTRIPIDKKTRYIKMIIKPIQGLGNYYLENDKTEVVFGLNKVKIYGEGSYFKEVSVKATSVLSKAKEVTWFWLQDGVVIDENLYFLPLLVGPNLSKPEGLQFSVKGVSLIKIPIINGDLDIKSQSQKDTPLFYEENGIQWLFGNAIMSNTIQSGASSPDGYIYIYGFTTNLGLRQLRVARVKANNFELLNEWEFFSDSKWVKELSRATPILDHISCEMSVSPIVSGENKGKYLAVFQYDVNSNVISYSIGERPEGPFTEPRNVYSTSKVIEELGRTAYAYNAKAHPHLSKSNEILVSYNVNSYDMLHNTDDSEVYRPRFIKIIDTSEE